MKLQRLQTKAFLACVIALLFSCSSLAMAAISIVANPQSQIQLSEDDVIRIYLGKSRFLPNGKPAKPIDQPEESKARAEFLMKVLKKTEPSLKSHWASIIFTGRGAPPQRATDNDAVKKLISADPNAIGYIDSAAVDSTVKVLLTIN